MKSWNPFIRFLLLALWVFAVQVDTVLTLRNKQYIPPPIQELPISDSYYNIQDDAQHQHKFDERKYANSKYESFEVHNPYKILTNNNRDIQKSADFPTNFIKNNYSPLQKTSIERFQIEHVVVPSKFQLDDPNLDVSYLGLAAVHNDNNQPIIVQHQINHKTHNPVSFSSNYQPTVTKNSNQSYNILRLQTQRYSKIPVQSLPTDQVRVYQTSIQSEHNPAVTTNFRSTVYLNPFHKNFNQEHDFKGSIYLPPLQHGSAYSYQNFEFKVPEYLPPQHSKLHSLQHYGSAQSELNFKPINNFKTLNHLPAQEENNAQRTQGNIQLTDSEYLPPEKPKQFNIKFNGPDYLPPKQQLKQIYNKPSETFKDAQYLPAKEIENNEALKGSDYILPSDNHKQQHQQPIQDLPPGYDFKNPSNAEERYEGPDYLPPSENHRQQHHRPTQNLPLGHDLTNPSDTDEGYKGLDYLPPSENNRQQHQQLIHNLPPDNDFNNPSNTEERYEGPDYLPPSENNRQQHQQSIQNLPPGYDFKNPSNAEERYEGPDYLPPSENNRQQHQQPIHNLPPANDFNNPSNTEERYEGPDYLPPANDFNNPSNTEERYEGPDYLPPSQINRQQHHQPIQILPPGYDFQKPPNAEEAIEELHQLPDESEKPLIPQSRIELLSNKAYDTAKQVKSTLQYDDNNEKSQQRTKFSLPVYHFQKLALSQLNNHTEGNRSSNFLQKPKNQLNGQQNQSSGSKAASYISPTVQSDYLPPLMFKGLDYLQPQLSQTFQQKKFKDLNYLPQNASRVMYPLSNYLMNVRPNDRYGNGIVFPHNRSALAKTLTISSRDNLTSMYQQLTSRPQYYAPTISYTNSQVIKPYNDNIDPNLLLFTQSQQALQNVRPAKVKQKTRTVQFINPKGNAVKTLKLLETLDQTGIKTIKILGPTAEQPQGTHNVVKIISGSQNENVQTLKIFNDHQDVKTINPNDAPETDQYNTYLPHRNKRNSNYNINNKNITIKRHTSTTTTKV